MSRGGRPEQDLVPVRKKLQKADLGLVPVFDEERKDLGLNSSDIQATSRVLAALFRLDTGSIIPTLAGEAKLLLEQQLGYALRREETRVAASQITQEGRRKFFRYLFNGVVTAAITGGAGLTTVLLILDEPRRKQEFEQTHTLGTKPTAPSTTNWIVYYEPKEEGVDFLRSTDPNSLVTWPGGKDIEFTGLDSTKIYLLDYTRSDGVRVPKLQITLSYTGGAFEEWILRDLPTPDMETRVVVFERVGDSRKKYLSISRNNAIDPSYRLEWMQKIKR